MSLWAQLLMQDPATPTSTMLLLFHDSIIMTMTLVMSIISYMLIYISTNNLSNRMMKEAHKMELIWTILPTMILLLLAIPSLHILYMMDESNSPSLTVKAMGHQWYWSYEYSDFPNIKFTSFMTHSNHLNTGEPRLMEVDNRMILPMKTKIRLLVSATDVIHSWTIPALGIKSDAIPGRLNQLFFYLLRPGIFYGQCSEICGANHSFMPIVLESINMKSFIAWSLINK